MKTPQNQHFSHHHVLNPLTIEEGHKINCNACEQNITEPFHGCIECKYYLHENCFTTPRALHHPSHPSHPLTLHSTPTYSCRFYTCKACDSVGNSFSLSCAICEFDIHLQCANFADTILSDKHPHELKLFFSSPYSDKNTVFDCDICRMRMFPHQWLYYCAGCDFGTHLGCVDGKRCVKEIPKGGEGNQAATRHYTPSVEDVNAVRKAEEAIEAARVAAMLQARANQAALDIFNPPRRYGYGYI